MEKISRRQFLKLFGCGAGSFFLLHLLSRAGLAQLSDNKFNGRPKRKIETAHDLVAVKGADPKAITHKAVESLGGMGKFVKPGATVVIKPNIGWDRSPEYAANTNPGVVAALVEMCVAAGAKRVNVFDITCNSNQRTYESSGILKAARDAGAKVYFADDWNFVNASFGYDSLMQNWPVFRDAIECDTFINVPVLKHHGLTKLTLGMKNLMGVCGGNRGKIHSDIGRKLVDMADFIRPELTVIDAYRVLTRNGPTGGNLEDVELRQTVIASADIGLADVYAAKFAGVDPETVPFIAHAIERGFARKDYAGRDILELTV